MEKNGALVMLMVFTFSIKSVSDLIHLIWINGGAFNFRIYIHFELLNLF